MLFHIRYAWFVAAVFVGSSCALYLTGDLTLVNSLYINFVSSLFGLIAKRVVTRRSDGKDLPIDRYLEWQLTRLARLHNLKRQSAVEDLKALHVPLDARVGEIKGQRIPLDLEERPSGLFTPRRRKVRDLCRRVTRGGSWPALAVLGEPGAGKSFELLNLFVDLKTEYEHGSQVVPLFIAGNDLSPTLITDIGEDPSEGLRQFLTSYFKNLDKGDACQNVSRWLWDHLASRQFVIIIDALDELTDKTRYAEFFGVIKRVFLKHEACGQELRFVFSCRSDDYDQMGGVVPIEVQPLTLSGIRRFFRQRLEARIPLGEKWQASRILEGLDAAEGSSLAQYLGNPYFLGLLVDHHTAASSKKSETEGAESPTNLPQLFEKMLDREYAKAKHSVPPIAFERVIGCLALRSIVGVSRREHGHSLHLSLWDESVVGEMLIEAGMLMDSHFPHIHDALGAALARPAPPDASSAGGLVTSFIGHSVLDRILTCREVSQAKDRAGILNAVWLALGGNPKLPPPTSLDQGPTASVEPWPAAAWHAVAWSLLDHSVACGLVWIDRPSLELRRFRHNRVREYLSARLIEDRGLIGSLAGQLPLTNLWWRQTLCMLAAITKRPADLLRDLSRPGTPEATILAAECATFIVHSGADQDLREQSGKIARGLASYWNARETATPAKRRALRAFLALITSRAIRPGEYLKEMEELMGFAENPCLVVDATRALTGMWGANPKVARIADLPRLAHVALGHVFADHGRVFGDQRRPLVYWALLLVRPLATVIGLGLLGISVAALATTSHASSESALARLALPGAAAATVALARMWSPSWTEAVGLVFLVIPMRLAFSAAKAATGITRSVLGRPRQVLKAVCLVFLAAGFWSGRPALLRAAARTSVVARAQSNRLTISWHLRRAGGTWPADELETWDPRSVEEEHLAEELRRRVEQSSANLDDVTARLDEVEANSALSDSGLAEARVQWQALRTRAERARDTVSSARHTLEVIQAGTLRLQSAKADEHRLAQVDAESGRLEPHFTAFESSIGKDEGLAKACRQRDDLLVRVQNLRDLLGDGAAPEAAGESGGLLKPAYGDIVAAHRAQVEGFTSRRIASQIPRLERLRALQDRDAGRKPCKLHQMVTSVASACPGCGDQVDLSGRSSANIRDLVATCAGLGRRFDASLEAVAGDATFPLFEQDEVRRVRTCLGRAQQAALGELASREGREAIAATRLTVDRMIQSAQADWITLDARTAGMKQLLGLIPYVEPSYLTTLTARRSGESVLLPLRRGADALIRAGPRYRDYVQICTELEPLEASARQGQTALSNAAATLDQLDAGKAHRSVAEAGLGGAKRLVERIQQSRAVCEQATKALDEWLVNGWRSLRTYWEAHHEDLSTIPASLQSAVSSGEAELERPFAPLSLGRCEDARIDWQQTPVGPTLGASWHWVTRGRAAAEARLSACDAMFAEGLRAWRAVQEGPVRSALVVVDRAAQVAGSVRSLLEVMTHSRVTRDTNERALFVGDIPDGTLASLASALRARQKKTASTAEALAADWAARRDEMAEIVSDRTREVERTLMFWLATGALVAVGGSSTIRQVRKKLRIRSEGRALRLAVQNRQAIRGYADEFSRGRITNRQCQRLIHVLEETREAFGDPSLEKEAAALDQMTEMVRKAPLDAANIAKWAGSTFVSLFAQAFSDNQLRQQLLMVEDERETFDARMYVARCIQDAGSDSVADEQLVTEAAVRLERRPRHPFQGSQRNLHLARRLYDAAEAMAGRRLRREGFAGAREEPATLS